MLPIVAGALAGAGGSFLNSIFGNIFGASQAQKNREFQERMLNKQMDFSREMWQKSAEYNSADQQRARLEKAGMNPYMMMNGGSAGTASSVSAGSAPSGATAQYTPFDFAGAGSEVVSALSQNKVAKEQAENIAADTALKKIDALTQYDRNRMNLLKTAYENNWISKQSMRQSIENFFLPHEKAAQIAGTRASAEQAQAQTKLLNIQSFISETQLKFLPQSLQADILLKASQTALNYKSVQQLDKQMEKIVWDMKPEIEKTTGKKLTNIEANALKSYLIRFKAYETEKERTNVQPSSLYQWLGNTMNQFNSYFDAKFKK